jgi:outer membrane receptor protein involved in Fe transport
MNRIVAAIVFALALCVPLHAQTATVSGSIVDETGASVPGATVTLTAAGRALSATTETRGEYTFRNVAPGTYELTVTLSGFSPLTRSGIAVGNAPVEVPSITLALAKLGETVVVSATKTESALIDAPATMSVVSSNVLETTPAQNYGDLLRSVPGVNAIQLSARDVNLTNRQGTSTLSNTQLVLLDGRSIYLDFFGLVLWDFVPTNFSDIKQIEVVRGPASAVWGANAVTGAVNIITKSPRESVGANLSLTAGGFSRDAGSTVGHGPGSIYSVNGSVAQAPNDRWSYRVSAGYLTSDPLPRPTGHVPVIQDPRDPNATVGGGSYPADASGPIGTSFQNVGTKQPKFDARVDQEIANGRITYAAGVAGSSGIIHTGIGPFDIQPGSYMGYGKVNYSRKALRVNFFTNFTSAEAPNLLLPDPATPGKPLQLNFNTQTYDVEAGDSLVAGTHNVFTFGGNARRNNFDITIAPAAENRTELGAYLQDEILYDRFRLTLGGRVDKFGNLSDPVFSPRVSATFKPIADQAIRVSFNRAFRSPSVINNFLDVRIVSPVDLRGLSPLLPAQLRPLVAAPFPLVVRAVGSDLPIGTRAQTELTEQSLTAYEVAYTGTFADRTTATIAFYVNDTDHEINFAQLPNNADPYTSATPPPGWRESGLPTSLLDLLALSGRFLPRTAFTYLNLGPLREKGVELSLDRRVSRSTSAFANYSFQARPQVLDDATPFPAAELALPPRHRFNAGFNYSGARFLGSASVNSSTKAFWSDVLSAPYHGFTDGYAMVNGSFGIRWAQNRVITSVKATNLLNREIQQHVFGDILKRSVVTELRFSY